jgi:hypothetical protein
MPPRGAAGRFPGMSRQCVRARGAVGAAAASTGRRRPTSSRPRLPDRDRAFVPLQPAPGKPRRDVGLQRRLVVAEARVAVDAVQRRLRRRHQLRRERAEIARELLDECDHRRADDGLEAIPPRSEPLAIVVAFQRAQEAQGVGRERRSQRATSTSATLFTPLSAMTRSPSLVGIMLRTTPPPEGIVQV